MKTATLLFGLFAVIGLGCERAEYSNRFTTPVKEISNTRVKLEDGKSVSIPKAGKKGATVLVLVRHSEKAQGDDPLLTAEGEERSQRLAAILQEMDLEEIYATRFRRNQLTARPVAAAQGLDITTYDTERLEDFLENVLVRNQGQEVLIVGHSNTTPQLLNLLLGREAYPDIADSDYGNLYVVSVDDKRRVSVLSLRF